MNLGRDWLTRKAQRRLLKTKNGPNKSKWRLWSNSRITRKEKKEKAEACEQKKWWAPPHCNLDSSLLLLVIALFNPRSLSLNSFTMLQVSFTFLNLFFQVHIQSSLFGARNFGFLLKYSIPSGILRIFHGFTALDVGFSHFISITGYVLKRTRYSESLLDLNRRKKKPKVLWNINMIWL